MNDALSLSPKIAEKRVLRLEERVYTGLLDDIRLGKFTLGQKLPSETRLAEQYKCSRPVIRSALAKLRECELIVSRQGSGSFVSSGVPNGNSGFAPLESIDDIASYFRFRKTIEAEAVQLAATRAESPDIAILRALLQKMERLSEDHKDTVETDFEFHLEIAKLSDNRFLIETLAMLKPNWMFIGKFVWSLGQTGLLQRNKNMNTEHKAIVDALETGGAKAAKKALIKHVEGSERRVFKGK